MNAKRAANRRDKEATKRRLVEAVGSLLARKGFGAVGVNAIAREAGVDKVLIYRYFGDLDALLEAFAKGGDFWPTVAEMTGDLDEARCLPVEERFFRFLDNFIDGLRRRPLTHEILAWEVVERNQLTILLEDVRERRFRDTVMALGVEELPAHVDFPALAAVVGATVNYLCVRSRHIRVFSQLDIKSDEGWERIRRALHEMFRHVLNAE